MSKAQTMRIIYPQPMVLPNKMAHSIQIIQTCWELASRGANVDLIVKKLEKKSIEECLQVYRLAEHEKLTISAKRKKTRKIFFYYRVLKKAWSHRNDKNTVIYLRDKKLARLLLRFKFFLRIPCIFESHALAYLVHQDKLKRERNEISIKNLLRSKLKILKSYRLERYIYQKADGIICQTAGIETTIRKNFNVSAPIEVIYSATGFSGKDYNPDNKNILYLGQLYPQKGTDILIESMRYLPHRKLIIIGGNKNSDVSRTKRLCERFGVKERVIITGYIEPRELEMYFDQIGVGVLPILDRLETRLFTSPLKLFDYMAAKIPIVASDLPSMREILTHGETAILVEPNNPEKLAQGIELILSNEKLAGKLSEQAYKKAQDFSWEKRSEKILSFIDDVLAGKNEKNL